MEEPYIQEGQNKQKLSENQEKLVSYFWEVFLTVTVWRDLRLWNRNDWFHLNDTLRLPNSTRVKWAHKNEIMNFKSQLLAKQSYGIAAERHGVQVVCQAEQFSLLLDDGIKRLYCRFCSNHMNS